MLAIQLAAVYVLDCERTEVYLGQAPHIDAPTIGGGTRSPECQNSANRTEVILGGLRVPLIKSQLLELGKQSETVFLHSMNKRASAATYRAVAHPDMVEIRVDLKPDLSAMTTTAIRRFHGAYQFGMKR